MIGGRKSGANGRLKDRPRHSVLLEYTRIVLLQSCALRVKYDPSQACVIIHWEARSRAQLATGRPDRSDVNSPVSFSG